MTKSNWSKWRPFPDPRKLGLLSAPFGPGCYEVRRRKGSISEKILFGRGAHVAKRMTSLLPKPLGAGARNNSNKRKYIKDNLLLIEYRTLACASVPESKVQENALRKEGRYKFPT
jgi:hypothetical protein